MTKKKPRITAEQRKDWRNLPYDQWNTTTVQVYFADTNREHFGVENYLPMRNYGFEQGRIKQALNDHGAELLHRAFDECFRTYRPSREYPLLTAGFAISYRINAIIPKLQAEIGQAQEVEEAPLDYAELAEWL